jgi:hypothetical protein
MHESGIFFRRERWKERKKIGKKERKLEERKRVRESK